MIDYKHLHYSNRPTNRPTTEAWSTLDVIMLNIGYAVSCTAMIYGLMWYALVQATGGV